MNKILQGIVLGTVIVLFGTVSAAKAQILTFDWSETGSSYGNGSGTFTFDPTAASGYYNASYGYYYAFTSFTGTFNGESITGTLIDGDAFSQASSLPTTPFTYVDMAFAEGGQDYLIGADSVLGYNYMYDYNTSSYDAADDAFNLTPVPEPASRALLVGGVGLFFVWRRFKTSKL